MKKTKTKKQIKFSETEFYFDDCEICRAMKKAEDEGGELSLPELKEVFARANKKNGVKGKSNP